MIVKENINGMVFIAKTKFYVYASEEALHDDSAGPFFITSSRREFEARKDLARVLGI